MINIIILIAFLLVSPVCAYAYLDPGSGAVLINLLIAGVAALLFSLKGVFLRLIGKKSKATAKVAKQDITIGILSEGRQYFATFEPIVKALITHQIHFYYYTLDIEDELLEVESDYMVSRFLGYGNIGYAKAGSLKVANLICTTPNIGCKAYPIQKSPHVQNLIHVFHSINDLSMYRKGSLDYYDSVFMVGDFQAKSIRDLEVKRSLKEKKLVSLGLPYHDTYSKALKALEAQDNSLKNVLVASSWGSKGLFANYSIDFIRKLTEAGFRVIARPHPQSYLSEKKFIEDIERQVSKLSNAEWDRDISPTKSMQRADVLISDTSSIRFDFAFIYQRPVLSLELGLDDMPGFEREDMTELWMDKAAHNIGIVLSKSDTDDIIRYVNEVTKEYRADTIIAYRDKVISNYADAGDAIARYIQTSVIGEDR